MDRSPLKKRILPLRHVRLLLLTVAVLGVAYAAAWSDMDHWGRFDRTFALTLLGVVAGYLTVIAYRLDSPTIFGAVCGVVMGGLVAHRLDGPPGASVVSLLWTGILDLAQEERLRVPPRSWPVIVWGGVLGAIAGAILDSLRQEWRKR